MQGRGYWGHILWVDLSSGRIERQTLPEETYRDFLGGYGLGAKILFERMPAKADPLGPQNILGFLPGLLTGTAAPFTGRYMVVGKSPLTGTWGDANSGGYFGPAIRACGVDGIFLTGASPRPVYLLYDGETARLLDAGECWGLDTVEAEAFLRQRHGKTAQVAAIGPAGENVSLISAIVNNGGRAAARSGLGAVMGAKKIKALVLTGKQRLDLQDPEKMRDMTRRYIRRLQRRPGWTTRMLTRLLRVIPPTARRLRLDMKATAEFWINVLGTLGTSFGNALSAESGDSPVKNWAGVGHLDFPFNRSRRIDGRHFLRYRKKRYGCSACPLRCGAVLSVPERNIRESHRPEYETCAMFGTLLLNDVLLSLIEANDLCNRAGMDTISAGATIAFAMECFEKGIISEKDTGGLRLEWGNAEAVIGLLRGMIQREGFGDVLADGVKRAAARIGGGAEKYALHSHGQELPAHDPKHFPSLALTYSTDPTPGRHTAADIDFASVFAFESLLKEIRLPGKPKDPVAKAQAQRTVVGLWQVLNCLGFCEFGFFCGPLPVYDLVEASTGWRWTYEDLLKTGLRIQNLRHAFNLREGINLFAEDLPGRATGHPPQEQGPHRGVSLETKRLKTEYCKAMGWDPRSALPSAETLKELGLGAILAALAPSRADSPPAPPAPGSAS